MMIYYDPMAEDHEGLTDEELDFLFFDVMNSYTRSKYGEIDFIDVLHDMEKRFTYRFQTAYYVIDYNDMTVRIYPQVDDYTECLDFLKDFLYLAYYYYQ